MYITVQVCLSKNEDIAYDVQDEIDAIEGEYYNGSKTREEVYYKTNQMLDSLFQHGTIRGDDYYNSSFVESKQQQRTNDENNRGDVNQEQGQSSSNADGSKFSKGIELSNF